MPRYVSTFLLDIVEIKNEILRCFFFSNYIAETLAHLISPTGTTTVRAQCNEPSSSHLSC